jgi:hypothetical protein
MPTMLTSYWKIYAFVALVLASFFAGYHYRSLQVLAAHDKIANAEIVSVNKKLISDNAVDAEYNKKVTAAQDAANKPLENKHEASVNCPLPSDWVRYINADN